MLIVVAAMVLATVVTLAFRSGGSSPEVTVDFLPTSSAAGRTPQISPTAAPSTPFPTHPAGTLGFAYPIAGACLPEDSSLMPGAPREYRNGTHEGIDFYESDNCAVIGLDTEVLTAGAGTVIRADWGYEDLTPERLAELEGLLQGEAGGDPDVLDAFRGRQVWIDHGNGVVTRYVHLSGIAEGVIIGVDVKQGELIGYVGESGVPESVTNPGTQVHLHFEIRIGDTYLGSGLDPEEIRGLYQRAFSPQP